MDPHYDNNVDVDSDSDTENDYQDNEVSFQDIFPLYLLTLNKVNKMFRYLKDGGSFIRNYQIVSHHIPVTECEKTEIVRCENTMTYVNSYCHNIPNGCSITTKVSNRVYIKEVHDVLLEFKKFQDIMNSINVDFPLGLLNDIFQKYYFVVNRYFLDLRITGDSITIDVPNE
jgi:hypothetical protein